MYGTKQRFCQTLEVRIKWSNTRQWFYLPVATESKCKESMTNAQYPPVCRYLTAEHCSSGHFHELALSIIELQKNRVKVPTARENELWRICLFAGVLVFFWLVFVSFLLFGGVIRYLGFCSHCMTSSRTRSAVRQKIFSSTVQNSSELKCCRLEDNL